MWLVILWTITKLIVGATLVAVSSIILMFKLKERKRRPVTTDGRVHELFYPVLDVFRNNFRRGWERDGAALCVYYQGQCVVDIWGGFADRESERRWREDTLQIIFSTSKAVGAICVAMLVDRGRLRYSDKMSLFWPEFAKNGKENITVEMILTHTSGLAYLDGKISYEDAADPERMAKLIEDSRPIWEPGKDVGYHALSYGWLIDQIIRRTDDKRRGIGQFFKEEIADKHGLDLHFGLPMEKAWRVARITRPTVIDRIDEFITDPDNLDYGFILKQYLRGGLGMKVATNPSWLQTVFKITLNNPELYALEQPAILGIGTARDMAKLAQLLIDGKLISRPTMNLLNEKLVVKKDIVTGAHAERCRGTTVMHLKRNGVDHRLIGHTGLGGQNLRWDEENRLVIAFLSNGLKGGLGDRARTYVRLVETIYDCLPKANDTSECDKSTKNMTIDQSRMVSARASIRTS
uniref:Beta-lactamase domain-containing protein n=1 Tax=Haemonchus contortus TaxID=6289 RepID=A0A7I4Y2S2_HAECO